MNIAMQTNQQMPGQMSGQLSGQTTSAHQEDRSQLLKDAIGITMEAAYGLQKLNEQHISNVLGGLVRSRLLSADDSYRLRDQLMDGESFQKAVDHRIEVTLKRRGLLTSEMVSDLHSRISHLERRAS